MEAGISGCDFSRLDRVYTWKENLHEGVFFVVSAISVISQDEIIHSLHRALPGKSRSNLCCICRLVN